MGRPHGFKNRGDMASATDTIARRKAAVLVTLDGFSRSGNKRSPTGSVASRLPTGVTGIETNDVNTTHGGDADE